jgi:putative DNA primase/helicase
MSAIPQELRERDQWVVWKLEQRDGKPTKVPYRADAAGRASTTDPATWSSYETAVDSAIFLDGIGFVFSPDDPYVGIDLDKLDADAGAIILTLDSYTERSVSGEGAHVIVRADLNGHPRHRHGPLEIYSEGRYFVFMGDHMEGTPTEIYDRQEQLERVLAEFLPAETTATPLPAQPVDLDDEQLLERMFAASNGGEIQRLWNGDTSAHDDDQSRADLALLAHLAFWTGRDPGRMERLFSASALGQRNKWDRADYRERTIQTALGGSGDTFKARPVRDLSEPSDIDFGAAGAVEPFAGISHAEALAVSVDDLPGGQLVEELVEVGTVGNVAGIPETFKSWTAQAISVAVAHGVGEILGRRVLESGPVGYFWQDDSRRNELERIQTFARVRETPADLPLRWFLNEGLSLPDDLVRLRVTIEKYGLLLASLDSFYNIAGGVDLKDRDAGEVVAALKRDVCDQTGCTILIVDHAPWPSQSNRGQARAYGDVHKGAAIRWGIYLSREKGKLYAQASANNMRGLQRSPVYWDGETLELRLVEPKASETFEEVRERTFDWLRNQTDWQSTSKVEQGVQGTDKLVRDSLFDLFERGEVALSVSGVGKTVEPVGAEEDAHYRSPGLRRWWKTHGCAEQSERTSEPLTPAHSESGPPQNPEVSERAAHPKGAASSRSLSDGDGLQPELDWT